MSRKISREEETFIINRKRAREAVFKALFQLDFNFEADNPEAYENLAIETLTDDDPEIAEEPLPKHELPYIEGTVKGTRAHLEEIDAIITRHLKEGWQLSRIMAVDKNILRLAIYEMKFAELPLAKGVAISEAVELAKRYGTDDSSRFVNGILEAISK